MANYDLTYEGNEVQKILDTGDELRDAGYIFRGEATPSTVPGTPTERVAYIGGPGTYTNFGTSTEIPAGCIGVFKYTGSAWSIQVINTGLSAAISSEAESRANADGQLQNAISAINAQIGNGYVYAGVATPSTSPVTGKVFYLAITAGTYTNFEGSEETPLAVTAGINILKNTGTGWVLDQVIAIDAEPTQGSDNLVKSGGVLNSIIQNGPAFDLSAYNAQEGVLATYADLSAALTALNALPSDFKKGGMSMKFVLTSDNKYKQFRLMTTSFSTTESDWQGVDDEPTAGSEDLVKSGGVALYRSFLNLCNTSSVDLLKEYSLSLKSTSGNSANIIPIDSSINVNLYDLFTFLVDFKKTGLSTETFVIRIYELDAQNQILNRRDQSLVNGLFTYQVLSASISKLALAFFSVNSNTGGATGYLAGYLFKGKIALNDILSLPIKSATKSETKSEIVSTYENKPIAGSTNPITGEGVAPLESVFSIFSNDLIGTYSKSLLSEPDAFVVLLDSIPVTQGNVYTFLYNFQKTVGSNSSFTFRIYEIDGNNTTLKRTYLPTNETSILYTVTEATAATIRVALNSEHSNVTGTYGYIAGYLFRDKLQLRELPINYGVVHIKDIPFVLGYYYNRGNGQAADNRRAYFNSYIRVYKNTKYTITNNKFNILVCFYDSTKTYVKDLTSWFGDKVISFTPDADGYIMLSIQNANGTEITQALVNSTTGWIGVGDFQKDIENVQEQIEGLKEEIAQNQSSISSLSTRVCSIENPNVAASNFPVEERVLRQKINTTRVFNKPVFLITTDSHCAPDTNPYGGNHGIGVTTMLAHAKVMSKLSDIIGVDWLGNLGDAVSGERYTTVQATLSDLSDFITLQRQAKAPLIYSIAHHELYLNGVQSDVGATRQQVWAVAGNSNTFVDYMKVYGSEVYGNDALASMYYYFDNPITKLRVINLCTVDGGVVDLSYNQLVWVRDYALANVPNGYGVIVIGHVTITSKLMGYDGVIKGFSTWNPTYDKAVNGLTLDSILNTAIDNGVNVLAYISGHAHRDNVWTLAGSKYPNIITCCDVPVGSSSSVPSQDGYLGVGESYDRPLATINEYCGDFFVVDVQEAVCRAFRFGCGHDRVIYCRNKSVAIGNTLDLTSIIGTDLAYTSLDTSVATIENGIVTGVAPGQTQIIAYDAENNVKHFVTIVVHD